ncbi:MAG: hypothetical protein HYZ72_04945 [Deltaproteobacteria bacterium]|nr:hypothetical protein [Deltaproteobacteria bacterium]
MRTLYPLLPLSLLLVGACSWLFSPKKVECCEKKAACCYEQMCCLPRYAKAAGLEPKPFTTDVPVYGTAQDLEPPPGAVIVKPGLLARWNPFRRSEDEQKPQGQPQDEQAKQDTAKEEKKEDKGFLGRLLPF